MRQPSIRGTLLLLCDAFVAYYLIAFFFIGPKWIGIAGITDALLSVGTQLAIRTDAIAKIVGYEREFADLVSLSTAAPPVLVLVAGLVLHLLVSAYDRYNILAAQSQGG